MTPHRVLHPGAGWRSCVAAIAFVAAVIGGSHLADVPPERRVAFLVAALLTAVLAAIHAEGIWEAGPYFVGIMAAIRLDRRTCGHPSLVFTIVVLLGRVRRRGVRGHAGPWDRARRLRILAVFLLSLIARRLRESNSGPSAARRARADPRRGGGGRHRWPSANGWPARCTTCSPTRCPRSCSSSRTTLLARHRGVDARVGDAIDRAHQLARTGLEEARRAIDTLRGDALPGPERLAELADAFEANTARPAGSSSPGRHASSAATARLTVYRTAQEALTNVRQHATPEHVEVRLDYLPESTGLVVEDLGPDGHAAADRARHGGQRYGLTGMRERAELLGGQLLAEPTGDGFRVELRLPA